MDLLLVTQKDESKDSKSVPSMEMEKALDLV